MKTSKSYGHDTKICLPYPDRIFSLEIFQILVPVKIFDIPSTITTDNIKPMAGSIRTFTIDFPYKKFGFQDTRSNTQLDQDFSTTCQVRSRIFSKTTILAKQGQPRHKKRVFSTGYAGVISWTERQVVSAPAPPLRPFSCELVFFSNGCQISRRALKRHGLCC